MLFADLAVGFIIAAIFADVVSRLIFASLGQTPAEPAWNYVLVLYLCLGVAATGVAIQARSQLPSPIACLMRMVAGAAIWALIGFYYGGSLTDNNPRWAIGVALAGVVLAALFYGRFATRMAAVSLAVTGAIAAYGFTFVIWSWASAFLSTHHFFWGISLTLLTLVYLGVTVWNLILVARAVGRSGRVSE